MSFASASNSADCSAVSNPLSKFSSHISKDRSLQNDRIARSVVHGVMKSPGPQPADQDLQLINQFRQPQANAFTFEPLKNELSNIHQLSRPHTDLNLQRSQPQNQSQYQNIRVSQENIIDSKNWKSEFSNLSQSHSQINISSPAIASNADSLQFQNNSSSVPLAYNRPMARSFMFNQQMGSSTRFQTPTSMMQQNQSQMFTKSTQIQELDNATWDEHFKTIDNLTKNLDNDLKSKGKEKEKEVENFKVSESAKSEQEIKSDYLDNMEDVSQQDFEAVWRGIQNDISSSDFMPQSHHDYKVDVDDSDIMPIWERDFDKYTTRRPNYSSYSFETDNQFLNHPDPFEEGVRLMETGGNLSQAALAFEAAVQLDDTRVAAWERLGSCQAQNEKEDAAIRALEYAIKLDPSNESALMGLAVSYTNEGYENSAYVALERWLAVKYPNLVSQARSSDPTLTKEDRVSLHARVTNLYLQAARLAPEGLGMDADVQVGLGVLFYGDEEYEKAIDCFNTAISVRRDDPLLWNRLGATLANSHRSEEAIDAYCRALKLRPSFVRARYNLGVSCINIGCYHEAAQHLLAALAMHAVVYDNNKDTVYPNQSTNIQETLRRTLMTLGREDLASKIGPDMRLDEFKKDFEF